MTNTPLDKTAVDAPKLNVPSVAKPAAIAPKAIVEDKKPYDPNAIVTIAYSGKTSAILYSSTDFSKVEIMPNAISPVMAKFVYNSTNPNVKALRYRSIKNKQVLNVPNGQTFTQFVNANFTGVNS